MKEKVLIFIPYQDSDGFLNDGILTREFAMLHMFYSYGYKTVINIKKPRTYLDKKRLSINEDYFPKGTIEYEVKSILLKALTYQFVPVFSYKQIAYRRCWWIDGYAEKTYDIEIEDEKEYLVYSNNPFAFRLLEKLKIKGCNIYFDIMDNFAIHPSLSELEKSNALDGYRYIFEFANIISANSIQTCEYMKKYTDKNIKLVKNGVFAENGNDVAGKNEVADFIRNEKKKYKKCVGYIGKLGLRLNADLIDEVSKMSQDVLFVFVGGCLKGQVNKKLSYIFETRNNVIHIKSVPSAYVYRILDEFDILAIPHAVGKAENGGDPLKLYQYLTRKKPIISTSIIGVDEFKDYIAIKDNPEEWYEFINNDISEVNVADINDIIWQKRLEPILKEIR